MKKRLSSPKKFFLLFLSVFLFAQMSAFSAESKLIFPLEGIEWNLQTTKGFQNISNVISEDNGQKEIATEVLFFNGMPFQSVIEDSVSVLVNMNLGLKDGTAISWVQNDEFSIFHQQGKINENLRCMEFGSQVNFMKIPTAIGNFSPLVSYSVQNFYSTEKDLRSVSSNSNFQIFSVGVEYSGRIFKIADIKCYYSLSPLTVEYAANSSASEGEFLNSVNYGSTIKFNTKYVSLTFFSETRGNFEKFSNMFDKESLVLRTSKIGYSFSIKFD